jgi:hypothetical protein
MEAGGNPDGLGGVVGLGGFVGLGGYVGLCRFGGGFKPCCKALACWKVLVGLGRKVWTLMGLFVV